MNWQQMATELNADEIERIRRNFKRCSDPTIEAIVHFRGTGDTSVIPAIARGIMRRYLPEAQQPALDAATDSTPLADLNIESLTMLEIILDVQDALDITIEDSELREFQTLGDILSFLEKKVVAAS